MARIDRIVEKVVQAVAKVPGIQAVVLGGSRARGTERDDSDIDIGIYYNDKLDLELLNQVAQELDDQNRIQLVYGPGDWGEWVNGGAWLQIDDFPVDLILRDISRVEEEIQLCQNGRVSPHYQAGHPHAFLNSIYMGELALSQLLWTKDDEIKDLKKKAEIYPQLMKKALINYFNFEASFSAELAHKNSDIQDFYYMSAHIVRAVSALNQVLFALNEEYCLNEKKASQLIDSFAIRPRDYQNKVNSIFVALGIFGKDACDRLNVLVKEVDQLVTEHYI